VLTRVAAMGAIALVAAQSAKATVIFADDFSTSSVPINTSYPTPTSNSTGYAIASNKAQSPAPSIATGHLKLGLAASTSALDEAQALFTTTPVALSNVGDYIELKMSFVPTGILGSTSTASGQMEFGLYHSGGSNPDTDLSSSGLSSSITTDGTNGVAGWTGYVTQYFYPATASKIVTRPAQTGSDNTDQDLVGNNFSTSVAYHNPVGSSLGSSTAASAGLVSGTDQYMEDMKISLTAAGIYEIDSTLSDVTNPGTPQSFSATNVTASVTSFDGMAFGWRETGSVISTMDVNSLTISTNVPEPATLGSLAIGALALIRRRK